MGMVYNLTPDHCWLACQLYNHTGALPVRPLHGSWHQWECLTNGVQHCSLMTHSCTDVKGVGRGTWCGRIGERRDIARLTVILDRSQFHTRSQPHTKGEVESVGRRRDKCDLMVANSATPALALTLRPVAATQLVSTHIVRTVVSRCSPKPTVTLQPRHQVQQCLAGQSGCTQWWWCVCIDNNVADGCA